MGTCLHVSRVQQTRVYRRSTSLMTLRIAPPSRSGRCGTSLRMNTILGSEASKPGDLSTNRSKTQILPTPSSHVYLALSLGVIPFEYQQDLWHQKTIVAELSCGVLRVILRLYVLTQYRRVTDGQTDTRRQLITALAQRRAVKKCRQGTSSVAELTNKR